MQKCIGNRPEKTNKKFKKVKGIAVQGLIVEKLLSVVKCKMQRKLSKRRTEELKNFKSISDHS